MSDFIKPKDIEFSKKEAKKILDALHDSKKWEQLYKTDAQTDAKKVRTNLTENLQNYFKKRQTQKRKSPNEKDVLDSFEIFSHLGHTDNYDSPSRSSSSRSSPSYSFPSYSSPSRSPIQESHHRQYTEEEIEEAKQFLSEAFEEEEDKHKSKKRKTTSKRKSSSKKGGKRNNKSQKKK